MPYLLLLQRRKEGRGALSSTPNSLPFLQHARLRHPKSLQGGLHRVVPCHRAPRCISPHLCSSQGGHRHITTPKLGILATENWVYIYKIYIGYIEPHQKPAPMAPRTRTPPRAAPSVPAERLARGWLLHLLPKMWPGFKIFVRGREEVGERRSCS